MSDRLLKESDVLKAIDKRVEELSKDPVFIRKNGIIDIMGVKKHILAIPSADRPQLDKDLVEPIGNGNVIMSEDTYEELLADRPQGEWIPATWQDEHCPERLKRHKCSECGQRAEQILVRTELVDNYYCNKAEPIFEYTHEEQLSKFCPSCGAHMKGACDVY